MRTPLEKEFLEAVGKMPDHLQIGILESMEALNSLPPDQRSHEKFRQILMSNGFSSEDIAEAQIAAGIQL